MTAAVGSGPFATAGGRTPDQVSGLRFHGSLVRPELITELCGGLGRRYRDPHFDARRTDAWRSLVIIK